MTERQDTVIRSSIIPVLLGNSFSTHILAAKIYLRTGIISYICDEDKLLWDYIDPISRFFPVFCKSFDGVMCEALDYLASNKEYLPIIIPCNDRYQAFVASNIDFLEARFIVATADTFFKQKSIRALTSGR